MIFFNVKQVEHIWSLDALKAPGKQPKKGRISEAIDFDGAPADSGRPISLKKEA